MMSKLMVLGVALSLISVSDAHAQICKTDSIPASTPTSQFTINSDGTVTDNKTALMWQQCSLGQTFLNNECSGTAIAYTWQQALQAADTLNKSGGMAGFSDWRVPNNKELSSIVERQCYLPAINLSIFPSMADASVHRSFWSSSSAAGGDNFAWAVNLGYGYYGWGKKIDVYPVRLVRSGP